MKIFGKGFNFSQDGPGNRLVYHLSGCNMTCLWCSNPDGMSASAGEEISTENIILECISCKPMFFSGGGVTFTGGEATLQADELISVLSLLKKHEINTAIETNGTSPRLPEISELVDYLIMDFKHYDSDILKTYTGLGNKNIKENFEYFCKIGRQLHIRIPVINGINSDKPEKFAEYFSSFDTKNVVFEFLPYHEYGKEKWKSDYKIKNGFVSAEDIKKFNLVFKEYGLKTVTT